MGSLKEVNQVRSDSSYQAATSNETIYTPLSIINILNNAISVREEKSVVKIRGLYVQGASKVYGEFVYDTIRDEASSCSLGMRISGLDRQKLKAGQVVEIKAFLTRKVDDKGLIKVLVNVTEVIGSIESAYSEADVQALELIHAKAQKGYRDVEGFLTKCVVEGKKPRVLVITGEVAIVQKDVEVGFGSSLAFYEPEFTKVSMASPDAITSALERYSRYDVVLLARGGGTGLEVFDTIEVAKAALGSRSMLLAAIGHAEDHTLVEKVVDRHFITPTAAGNFFRDVYERATERLNGSKAKMIEDVTKLVKKEFEEKVKSQDKLLAEKELQLSQLRASVVSPQKLFLYVLAALVIGFVLAIVLISVLR